MGWDYCRDIEGDATPEDCIRRRYTFERKGYRSTVLDAARVGATVYAALQVQEDDKPAIVTALVVLTQGHPKHAGFGQKGMDETWGPSESDCPARILDLLSPTSALGDVRGWAAAWRLRCRAKLEARAKESA